MTVFCAWAPNAQSLDLQLGKDMDNRVPMRRGENDWWSVDIPEAGAGTDYFFIVNGGQPLPDPRSNFQPEGVYGPSQVVDHSAFPWTDQRFQAPPLSSAVIYELHIGTFTPGGTFDSAIERLEYLRELGITHLEILPVNEFPGKRGWGYDGVDLFAVQSSYGGPEALKRFVNAAHDHGLAVILDVVYNHFGPSGNFATVFGPYLTDHHHTPWGQAVNLDTRGSDEVRRYFIENALMWLRDYHFDVLRLDAVHALLDQSAMNFLEELAREVHTLQAHEGRHLALIAESDLNDPRIVETWDAGGYQIDAQWLDDFRHSLHTILTGECNGFHCDFGTMADLAQSLRRGYVYCGQYSKYRGRKHGRPTVNLPGSRFVGFIENHDQVGNRAKGDRAADLMSPGRFKIAMAVLFTAPFIPMLFQGEEWGSTTPFLYFTDHVDPELARAVSEGRKKDFAPFGWTDIPDPQDPETFERSKVDWAEKDREPYVAMLAWTRDLIELRRTCTELRDGDLERMKVRFDDNGNWMVYGRGEIRVAFNIAGQTQHVPLPGSFDRTLLMASDPKVELVQDAIELPPDSVAIIRQPAKRDPC